MNHPLYTVLASKAYINPHTSSSHSSSFAGFSAASVAAASFPPSLFGEKNNPNASTGILFIQFNIIHHTKGKTSWGGEGGKGQTSLECVAQLKSHR